MSAKGVASNAYKNTAILVIKYRKNTLLFFRLWSQKSQNKFCTMIGEWENW